MSLEQRCGNILLKNKQGVGIIDYKELSKINVDKFLEGKNTYYTSNELWKIAKEIYSSSFKYYLERIAKEENVTQKDVNNELRKLFQYRVYEASIIEAICIWNIKNSKDYVLEPLTDDEDRNNKIDIKYRHKETQIVFNVQVKKWRKNFNIDKRANELYVQINLYGAPAIYFEIEFSEKDRNSRKLFLKDLENVIHVINFPGTFGRSKSFNEQFIALLDIVLEQRLLMNQKYYIKKFAHAF